MSRQYRSDGIVSRTPAADYTTKRGYLGSSSAGTFTISSSATTKVTGVILDGNQTTANYATEKISVGILGATAGTVPMRLSGTVVEGAFVQQSTDGTVVTDAGSGARVLVGVALESGGTGENIEVAPITPVYYAS